MNIKQDTREFGRYIISNRVQYYLITKKGRFINQKSIDFRHCADCGKIIGCVMGGMKRHIVACKAENLHWLSSEIQRLYDKNAWGFPSLTTKEREYFEALKYEYHFRAEKHFEPQNNCPA